MVYRAARTDNSWMSATVKEEIMAYRASEKFKKRSDQASKNRKSKGQNGKAPGTHTMGRCNTIQLMDKMCHDAGDLSLPSPNELVKKAKTKKAGGYVSPTVEHYLDEFQKKMARLLETVPEGEIDDKEVYYEAVGGFNKKGKVPGLGKATPHYYDRPRPSFGDEASSSYVPGFVSTLSKEYHDIKEQLKVMSQWKSQMEQTLAAKGIHIPTESCNPNLQAQNDRFDHGVDDGGNNEGYGGDFATEILG